MHPSITFLRNLRTTLHQELNALSLEQLNAIPSTHKNNIYWHLIHCVAVQQALCYQLSGLPPVIDASLVKQFGKGTVPEQAATAAEVKQLGDWLLSTVDQLEQDWNGGIFKNFRPYTIKQIGAQLHTIEDAIAFNTIHEGIHYGYILTFKKLI